MVPADGQADLAVGLEAAGGGEEAEGGRAERVGGGQEDAPVVETGAVGGGGRAGNSEVPFEEVGVEGGSVQGVVGGGGEFGGFFDCVGGGLVGEGVLGVGEGRGRGFWGWGGGAYGCALWWGIWC